MRDFFATHEPPPDWTAIPVALVLLLISALVVEGIRWVF